MIEDCQQRRVTVKLYLSDKGEFIEKEGVTLETFFRASYQWRFGRDFDPIASVTAYRESAIVPAYVREYIKHIETKENHHAATQ